MLDSADAVVSKSEISTPAEAINVSVPNHLYDGLR